MFLSIIVPVFNSENTITRCLDSIMNQDFCDYEIIVINDGSTDSSDLVINKYIKDNQSIRIIYRKTDNQGPAIARNLGIELASGDYVWFVDSDDEIEKESLETIYETLKKSNSDILRFSCRTIKNNVSSRKNFKFTEDIYTGNKLNKFVYESLYYSWQISMNCWQHVYKRKVVQEVMFINNKNPYAEDILINCLLYTKAESIQVITDILYKYYINEGSLAHKKRQVLQSIIDSYLIIKKEYLKYDIWKYYKNAIISSYIDFVIIGRDRNHGAIYLDYNSYDDYSTALEKTEAIISSKEFQELVNDALNRELPEYLLSLFNLLKNNKVIEFIQEVSSINPNKQREEKEENNQIEFNVKLELMKVNNEMVAVPVDNSSKSFLINLTDESAEVLKKLIETNDINETLEMLYQKHKNDDKEEIKEILLDFVCELRSQRIIK